MTTFTKKILTAEITTGKGEFGAEPGETVTLTGLRMLAEMSKPIGDSMGELQLRIYGMPQDRMNRLTSIGTIRPALRTGNRVKLSAGDAGGMHLIFDGMMTEAWADYNQAPDVPFNIVAYMGMEALLTPAPAISIKGSADVAQIMDKLAKVMGLTLEDGGVKVKLSSPCFEKTALQQIRACAQAADIWYSIEPGKLVIWPKNSSRPGEVPLISPETGMVGYPALNAKGMSVKTLFNPRIRLGGGVQIQSSLPMATKKMNVFNFGHSLSCEVPGGPWFTNLECGDVSAQY